MSSFWHKAIFFLIALPYILRTAWRVGYHNRRCDLEQLPARLRAVPCFQIAFLRKPQAWKGCVAKLLWCLPPFRMGSCLKRSLYLLDLWTRCGHQPKLTLGVATHEGKPHFHAWISSSPSEQTDHPTHQELWTQ